MPSIPKPNNPAAPKRGGGQLAQAAKRAQEQLAGQPLEPARPTQYTRSDGQVVTLTGQYGSPEDPFNRRGGLPEQMPPPPGWDTAAEDLSQLPNWEKLNASERAIMGALPGITTTLADAYKNFDDWTGGLAGLVTGSKPVQAGAAAIGAALGALDVGAEATERTAGLLRQYLDARQSPEALAEFKRNFKAAWYGGTLAADTANVEIAFGPDGLVIPNDLGGAAALTQARQRIAELVAGGSNYHDAAIIARDEYYASLGALAIRAQVQDLTWHLVIDPVNIILGTVKPVERLHVLRGKLVGLEATAEELAALEKTADAARTSLKLAEDANDVEGIARATAEVTRAEQALEFAHKTTLTPAEQRLTQLFGKDRIINLTGGAPDAAIPKPGVKNLWNLFALTPQARAHEILTIVRDFAVSHVISANRTAEGGYDVEGIVRGLQRIADGAHAPELGHAVASIEGRTFRSITGMFAGKADELLASWKATGNLERPLLDVMSETLGVSPYEIIRRIDQGENSAVLAQFLGKLAQAPDAQQVVQGLLQANNLAELTPDVLARLGNVLGNKAGKFAGYTDELFVAELMGHLTDAAAQQAIRQFGVKARGVVADMAELVKAGEALAFLKANPGYPVRNWINNNVTLIARGAFGTALDTSAKKFDELFGFVPPRYSEGVGAADLIEEFSQGTLRNATTYDEGAQKIINAGKADNRLNQASDALKRFRLPGPLDMTRNAAGIERAASERAYFTYFSRYLPPAYRGLLGKLADFDPAFAQLPRQMANEIENAFLSAKSEAEIKALFNGDNLKLNFENFLARAERDTGLKMSEVLGYETVRPLADAMVDAAKKGDRAALEAAVRDFGAGVQAHIDDALENSIGVMRDEAAARVAAEGPGAFSKVWADSLDEFWAAHERHALDIQQAVELARKAKGPAAEALWQESRESSRAFFQRQFDRIEQRVAGFTEKALELKLPGAELISAQLKKWRKGWEDFFAKRDALWDGYWKAVRASETPPVAIEQIYKQLDDAYLKMVGNEARYQAAIDAQMANMLPDSQRSVFQAWRNRVSEFRTADKETVIAFRQRIRNTPPSLIEDAYREHWKQRIEAWSRLRQEEQAGLAALMGNQPAAERYADNIAQAQQQAAEQAALLEKALADQQQGAQVLTDAQAEVERLQQALADAQAQTAKLQERKPFDSPLSEPQFNNTTNTKQRFLRDDIKRAVGNDGGRAIKLSTSQLLDQLRDAAERDLLPADVIKQVADRLKAADRADEVVPPIKQVLDEIMPGWKQYAKEREAFLAGKGPEPVLPGTELIPSELPDVAGLEKQLAEAQQRLTQAQDEAAALQQVIDQAQPVKPVVKNSEFAQQEALAARIKAGESWDSVLAEFPADQRESMRGAIEMAMAGATRSRKKAPPPTNFLPDMEQIVKPELYSGVVQDQLWYTRGQDMVRALKNAALDLMDENPSRWTDLPEAMQASLRGYAAHAQGALKDARYAAMRMGEFGRDSALLNYNRRFNYNTLLGMIAPFEFWSTQSAWKWALHSIDRPAMLAAYLRISKFLQTAYRPEEGLPSRLRGHIRIPLPFLPEWMGNEVFVDPLRLALPFDNWMQPFEQLNQQDIADMGAANRKLEELYNDGQISREDYQAAAQTHSGPDWERALALARQDDSEGRMSWADAATALFPPHVPLLYAYDALQGKNPFEERGPLIPLTRSLGNMYAVLGLDPAGPYNPEAALRKQFGLHPFGKWDDYLAERMLTNMVAAGELGAGDAKRAMIEHQGAAWDEAQRRAGIERAGGNVITALMGLGGVPARGYPPGEEANRKLKDDYAAAWERYDASGGDYEGTVGAWLKDHPGYEARLALFKKPEERLQQFLVDEFWDTWNNLPDLTKNQLRDQLGSEFTDGMFSADTGWGKNVPPEKLAVWLKLMGGDPPGTLTAAEGQTVDLAAPEVAQRAQVFYNTRDAQYPGWKEAQNGYFAIGRQLEQQYGVSAALVELDRAGDDRTARNRVFRQYPALGDYFDARKAATAQYLDEHPVLSAYWHWRDQFLARNSDVAPYLDDDPVYAERATSQPQFNYSRAEWQQVLGYPLYVLALHAAAGENLRPRDREAILARVSPLGWPGSFADLAQTVEAAR